jgi:predicted enzyme related to lactoylglutathione lyase
MPPRLVGISHVALEVDDLEPSLAFYGSLFDDKEAARRALAAARAEVIPGRRLDFLDPDGNRVEIVQYDQIPFTKTAEILRGMWLELDKSDEALAELREKGLAA